MKVLSYAQIFVVIRETAKGKVAGHVSKGSRRWSGERIGIDIEIRMGVEFTNPVRFLGLSRNEVRTEDGTADR